MLFVLLFSRRVASHSCETLRELLHDQTKKRGVQQVNGNWRGTNCNSSTLFARIKIFYLSVADYSFRQIKSLPLQQFFLNLIKQIRWRQVQATLYTGVFSLPVFHGQ